MKTMLFAAVTAVAMGVQAYTPAKVPLMTEWGEKVRLGGSIYTQTTDVEGEVNGLMTYDRKVLKFNPDVLKTAHERIVKACLVEIKR